MRRGTVGLAGLVALGLLAACSNPPEPGSTAVGSAPSATSTGATSTTTASTSTTLPAAPLATGPRVLGPARIHAPRVGAAATSPLVVEGLAPGPWFFEASFPVVLQDASGRVIAQAPAQAEGEWMTEDEVPFRAELTFEPPAFGVGKVVAVRMSMEDGRELQRTEVAVRFTGRGAGGPAPVDRNGGSRQP